MKDNKGFTLIELLAVILIIGSLTALAFPSLREMVTSNKQDKQDEFKKVLVLAAKNYVLKNKVKGNGTYIITYTTLLKEDLVANVDNEDIGCKKLDSIGDDTCYVVVTFTNDGKVTNYEGTIDDSKNPIKASNYETSDSTKTPYVVGVTPTVDTDFKFSVPKRIQPPNKPVLADNMYPVYYKYVKYGASSEDCTVGVSCKIVAVKADASNNWYNYDEGMWANAVTCSKANTGICSNLKVGDVIDSSNINSYWVWIPQYEYKKTDSSYYDVNFVSKGTSRASDGYILSWGGDVSGIWVAKFDASKGIDTTTNDSYVLVVPKKKPWTSSYINDEYISACNNMIISQNDYGFSSTEKLSLSMTLMKQYQFDAIKYLAKSKYSKLDSNSIKSSQINDFDDFKTGYDFYDFGMRNNLSNINNSSYSTSYTINGIYDMVYPENLGLINVVQNESRTSTTYKYYYDLDTTVTKASYLAFRPVLIITSS